MRLNQQLEYSAGSQGGFKRQKNRTPLQQGLLNSSYEFYYVGRPTQQQIRNHMYRISNC